MAAAIPDRTAETVARAFLHNVVLIFGIPLTILSDNAQEFVGQVMTELTKLLNISHTLTSMYRPQTGGVSQRWFSTLNTMMSHYLVSSKTNWDMVLRHVVFAYNICGHESMRISPFFLLHGFEPTAPWDLAFPTDTTRPQSFKVLCQLSRDAVVS